MDTTGTGLLLCPATLPAVRRTRQLALERGLHDPVTVRVGVEILDTWTGLVQDFIYLRQSPLPMLLSITADARMLSFWSGGINYLRLIARLSWARIDAIEPRRDSIVLCRSRGDELRLPVRRLHWLAAPAERPAKVASTAAAWERARLAMASAARADPVAAPG